MLTSLPYDNDETLSLLMADGIKDPRYPATSAEFLSIAGITPTALYLFNEASGDVLDKVGSANLTAVNTPTFGYVAEGRKGIHYDGATDAHRADVNAPASLSFITGCVFKLASDLNVLSGVFGRMDGSAADGYAAYVFANVTPAYPTLLVRDTGSNSTQLFHLQAQDWFTNYPGLLLWQVQVDRAANKVRSRISKRGVYVDQQEASIVGFGALSGGAAQTFGTGQYCAAISGGLSSHYLYYATGAQTEGSTAMATIARRLGWE
jgi:hypothetical protein